MCIPTVMCMYVLLVELESEILCTLSAGGMGIGLTVSRTLNHPSYLRDPHQAAKEVWEASG